MASAAKKYAFRRRFDKHNYSLIGAELSDDDEDDGPVTEAMTAAAEAGLDAAALSHMEERDFNHVVKGGPARIAEYLGVRNHILTRWHVASTGPTDGDAYVAVDAICQSLPEDQAELARETHAWLVKHGGVNFGCPGGADLRAGDAAKAARAAAAAAQGERDAEKRKAASADVSDAQIVERTVVFLRGADMNSTTERQIRAAVEADLDRDLSDRKLVIRSAVTKFLADPSSFAGVGDAVDDATDAASALAKAVSATTKGVKPLPTKPVIVVGAGPAGLAAARAIRADGHDVFVLEARARVGGRVFTCAANTETNPLSVPIDFGASIVTGTEADPKRRTARPWLGVRADPSFATARALGLKTTTLRDALPLFDLKTGARVDDKTDARAEKARDVLMDHARLRVDREGADKLKHLSLEQVIDAELLERYGGKEGEAATAATAATAPTTADAKEKRTDEKETLSASDRRLLGWHWANLEYGCSAPLSKVSMAHWNQDEAYGGFGGAHRMLKGGYGAVTDALAKGLDVRFGVAVDAIARVDGDGDVGGVVVTSKTGEVFEGSACVVTVPLGCLKNGDVTFSPPLSASKTASVARLGFGRLNKIALEFPEAFWDDSVDYFGCAAGEAGESATRGRMFMFWNLAPVTGKPVLAALVAGEAAEAAETEPDAGLRDAAMAALRVLAAANAPGEPSPLGDAAETKPTRSDDTHANQNETEDRQDSRDRQASFTKDTKVNDTNASTGSSFFTSSVVPDPVAVACTRWGGDPFSRGSYSYVAVGASGDDYDELGRPEGRVLFAGEHTCREHPDTVGGAMLSGWRAARHAMHIMRGDAGEPFDEVFALPTLDDLADDEPAGDSEDDSASDDSASDDDESDDDELDDETGKRKKSKGKKKKRRRGDDDGPEDDDAARERARERLAREAAERREQLERDAKEATEGKEEVKKVLRLLGDGFGSVTKRFDADHKFDAFCALAPELETHSGRRAFVDAVAAEAFPEPRRDAWATERDGLQTLVRWMEQITTKESGAALAARCIALLLKLPADVRLIRASGAARVMQQRFATHPKPEVRLLARKCAHKWTRAAHREKTAARAGDAGGVISLQKLDARSARTSDDAIITSDAIISSDAPPRGSEARKQTVDEMIASADGLAEGGAAAEAARAAKAAEAALAAATSRAEAAAARSAAAAAEADAALRDAWSAGSTKKNAFKQRSFEEFEAHKKRKREHKKREKERREREDAAEAAEDARASAGGTADVTERLRASAAALTSMDVDLGPRDTALREIRKRVLKFAHAHLQKSGAGKKMGKEKRDAVCAKTAAKVCENSTSADAAAAEGGDAVANFLTHQRKSKIKKMLDAYVAR